MVHFSSPNFKGVRRIPGNIGLCTIMHLEARQPPSGLGTEFKFSNLESISNSALNINESNIGRRWENEGMTTISLEQQSIRRYQYRINHYFTMTFYSKCRWQIV